mmetsp:Transcript_5608/g.9863  ORF Transcript_5608/g.9863 Transcript_5608/m.9863 type:complete len:407 (-) Transcript_5608:382-1602(-)
MDCGTHGSMQLGFGLSLSSNLKLSCRLSRSVCDSCPAVRRCQHSTRWHSRSSIHCNASDNAAEALGLEHSWDPELLQKFIASSNVEVPQHNTPKESKNYPKTSKVVSKDAMSFFEAREGEWSSWRVTHHLAFRRSETGESDISMKCLDASDERIVELCKAHDVAPESAVGGCYVTWHAKMSWDQEGENHEGSTVFALVPDNGSDGRKGKILRDRGYAEIVQIAGEFYMDESDGLNLVTPYDGGEVVERFAFDGPDIVHRVSTVKRFGGFATATYATERRAGLDVPELKGDNIPVERISWLGVPADNEENDGQKSIYGKRAMYGARARSFGAVNSKARDLAAQGPPSMRSAFSSGFGNTSESSSTSSAKPKTLAEELAAQGPPSMQWSSSESTEAREDTNTSESSSN